MFACLLTNLFIEQRIVCSEGAYLTPDNIIVNYVNILS